MRHKRTYGLRSRTRAPADLFVSHAGDRLAQLLGHFFHAGESKTECR